MNLQRRVEKLEQRGGGTVVCLIDVCLPADEQERLAAEAEREAGSKGADLLLVYGQDPDGGDD